MKDKKVIIGTIVILIVIAVVSIVAIKLKSKDEFNGVIFGEEFKIGTGEEVELENNVRFQVLTDINFDFTLPDYEYEVKYVLKVEDKEYKGSVVFYPDRSVRNEVIGMPYQVIVTGCEDSKLKVIVKQK